MRLDHHAGRYDTDCAEPVPRQLLVIKRFDRAGQLDQQPVTFVVDRPAGGHLHPARANTVSADITPLARVLHPMHPMHPKFVVLPISRTSI